MIYVHSPRSRTCWKSLNIWLPNIPKIKSWGNFRSHLVSIISCARLGKQGPKKTNNYRRPKAKAGGEVGLLAASLVRPCWALSVNISRPTFMSSRWLLLCHALCFSLMKASAHTVELNDMFGQIQSPGYPDSYPSDSEVTWNITVPEGFRIKLYFMHFNLESSYLCEYDYVKVSSPVFPTWPRSFTGS